MSVKVIVVVIASVLACIGNISYVRDVLRGRIRPHPYTWFVWSIVSMTTFFGGMARGAGVGIIPTGVAEVFTIIIFISAVVQYIRNPVGQIRPIDHYFLALCLLGLIPWALTSDPTWSVVTVVAVDVIAFIPTLRKTWNAPHTEHALLFEMNVARHALTLVSLDAYNIATTIHSIAMIVTNTLMTVFITRKRTHKRVR